MFSTHFLRKQQHAFTICNFYFIFVGLVIKISNKINKNETFLLYSCVSHNQSQCQHVQKCDSLTQLVTYLCLKDTFKNFAITHAFPDIQDQQLKKKKKKKIKKAQKK
eukprot:TRINITY_DN25470_c0_g1_i1.p2 TRINITY_DN25470_c0_g1~~TRINITY_DN25470_c0_g1_i1.p2  ORF type:complete len:107 (-),score=5.01 TRINITY_DN25470_c0_g1_i1:33-353(-)